jgi:glycosyltransferase involved in cell wall biosynthesis
VLIAGAVGAVKDQRKGFDLLIQAVKACVASGWAEKWRLLVFGAETGPGREVVGVPVTYCGNVKDERDLPPIYQSADVYTLPSLQDNLPNTVVEAFACGTPVVAFRTGGLANMITDGRTGRLAEPFSTQSLAGALRDALSASVEDTWRKACRDEFERVYAWPVPAEKYLKLYQEMMKETR